jgi:hypothetical protein
MLAEDKDCAEDREDDCTMPGMDWRSLTGIVGGWISCFFPKILSKTPMGMFGFMHIKT